MRAVVLAAAALGGLLTLALAATPPSPPAGLPDGFDPDLLAGEIPQPLLGAYLDAADTHQIDWALLAAIGKLECDHGRLDTPGCWPPGSVNHAGARGPMQFLGSTWRATAGRHTPDVAGPPPPPGGGWGTDADGDGIADPWNSYDAVHAAARFLVYLGARTDPHTAAKHYNAGPHNPNPTAGEGYATRTLNLVAHYHTLAGTTGPGTPTTDPPQAARFRGAGGGCSLPDPTGTGGCVTPRTAHLVTQLRRHFGDQPQQILCWAPRPANPASDHPQGRACDITYGTIGRFPTPTQRAQGWTTADWLTDNADQLAIAYLIWDARIWTPTTGWHPYTGAGIYNPNHPTGGHYDHIHISVKR
jgi:hypothetical protein